MKNIQFCILQSKTTNFDLLKQFDDDSEEKMGSQLLDIQ